MTIFPRRFVGLILAALMGAMPIAAHAGAVLDWSTTAATNATADSTINWAEGMTPGAVNDSSRAEMASIKKWALDWGGALVTTGSANAYVLTTNQVVTSMFNGLTLRIRANFTNTGAATIAVDGLTAENIKYMDGTTDGAALTAGMMSSGGVYDLVYSSVAADFMLLDPDFASADTTFSGANTFSGATTFSATSTAFNSTGSTGSGLLFYADNASPAANDYNGDYEVDFNDSAGNYLSGGDMWMQLDDPTNGSEDTSWAWANNVAGTDAVRMHLGAGLYMTGATEPGAGKIAATGFVEGGTALSSKYAALAGSGGQAFAASSFTEGGTALSSKYQPLDGDLTALAALGTGGLTSVSGDTWVARTITAGNGISVSNGDGVSGNPTITNTGYYSGGTDVAVADGGTGSSTAAGARTALGLGTAATATTGTSGATLPFLNGTNTWSGVNGFTGAMFLTGATGITGSYPYGGVFNIGVAAASAFAEAFYTSGGANLAGDIFINGSATTYNTSSDGRIKINRHPLDAGSIFDKLDPLTFTWKTTGQPGVGFVAQDLYQLAPEAVHPGDNNPGLLPGDPGFQMWSADYSRLMPYVAAELHSLRQRVAYLEAAQTVLAIMVIIGLPVVGGLALRRRR